MIRKILIRLMLQVGIRYYGFVQTWRLDEVGKERLIVFAKSECDLNEYVRQRVNWLDQPK